MIRLKRITIFSALLAAALVLVCGQAVAADKTLTVGKVSGAVGATLSVPLTINDPAGVGGVAFTLTYNPAFFEFIDLQPGGKTIADGSGTYTTDQLKNNLFYQANDEKVGNPAAATGRLMVAAAAADGLSGTNLVLLNARFKILGGNGEYPITVFRTIIQNTAAGYTVPTTIPVFVGTSTKNGQGMYDTTNFPVYPATLVAGSITVQGAKYNITGSVVYQGGSPANGATVILKRSTAAGYVLDAQTTAGNTGAYTFTGKPAGTYQVAVVSNNPGYFNSQSDPFNVTTADYPVPQITLPAPQRLTGTVTLNGGYVAGLQVKVMSGSTVIGIYPVNPDGTFQTPPLPQGSYKLYAVYGSKESPELTAGGNYNWTETLRSIGGTITGLTGGATVMASSATAKLQKTITVSGDATYGPITNLVPASDYIVSVTSAGLPVLYYNQKTDITQANAVDISSSDQTAVNFNFTGITKGTISGTVTENSAGANIGVFASEINSPSMTYVMAVNGAYSFTLPPGTFEIFVIKANGKIFYYSATATTEDEAGATPLTVTAGGALTGKNLDITECNNVLQGSVTYRQTGGDPAANALITAISNKGRGIAITGPNGAYSIGGLCQASYFVEMNPLNSKYAVQSATVTVPPAAGGTATQNFVIDTGNVLSGQVQDSGNGSVGVGNAMIYLLDQETGGLVNGRMHFSDNSVADRGKYTIADIPHGIYNMNVSHPEYRNYSEANLSIRTDMTKNIPLVKGAFFDVTVTDADTGGTPPLASALVIVVRPGAVPVYALTNMAGNCKIYGLDATQSDYLIIVQKAGFVRKALTGQQPSNAGTAVPISLNRPAALFDLSGTITSTCGGSAPVNGAIVLVSSATKDFFASALTNASGNYSFTDLPQSNDYRFVVVPGGALRTQVQTGLNYTSSPQTNNVAIPCGSTITGTVTRTGTSPIYVFLYTAAGQFIGFTQADGSTGAYSFTGLDTINPITYKVLAVSAGNTPKWYDAKTAIDAANTVSNGGTANITLTP